MSDILFSLFYFLLFSVIIFWSKWFRAANFGNKSFLLVFYLKLLFGVGLWYIYTHIYKNRVTSDIFKYYDDAKIIFNTLHTNAGDYFSMLTGIGDSGSHFQSLYHSMNSWDNAYESTLYNNSHFIIRLNAFFLLFSQGHYAVHVIFMCFIALIGLTYIYKAFVPFLQDKSKILFVAVFLFPSVILWSSGILKEGLVWFGVGLSIYYFFQLTNKGIRLINILFILIGFLILFEVKAYVLLCLLPCFAAQYLIKKTSFFSARPFITYASVLLLYIFIAFVPHLLFHSANPLQMISDKQTDFNRICQGGIYLENLKDSNNFAYIKVADSTAILPVNWLADSLATRGIQFLASNPVVFKERTEKNKILFKLRQGTPFSQIILGNKDTLHLVAKDKWFSWVTKDTIPLESADSSTVYWIYTYIETANSRILIDPIKPNLLSLLTHIPQALKVSMLLPYPWQVHSAMTGIYCMENIFVILLFFLALFLSRRPIPNKDLVLFCLTYCLMMLVLIGLVTPILGGIERYKSVVIPFMFILLLLISKKPLAKNP